MFFPLFMILQEGTKAGHYLVKLYLLLLSAVALVVHLVFHIRKITEVKMHMIGHFVGRTDF